MSCENITQGKMQHVQPKKIWLPKLVEHEDSQAKYKQAARWNGCTINVQENNH